MSNRLSPRVFLDSVKNNILIKIKKPLLSSSDCLSGLPSLNVSLNMASNERDLFVSQKYNHSTVGAFSMLLLLLKE